MPDNYIELIIPVADKHLQEILIARLAEAGAIGFEEDRNMVKASVPETDFDETLFAGIIAEYQLTYTKNVIAPANWNAVWESGFTPVSVDHFCYVRAGFHGSAAGYEHEIVITPKMSFGTGHHATTWLMIKAMSEIDLAGKQVFDFGTGTGILAILAEQCGAARVLAIDNDEWSIENAMENFNVNKCRNIFLTSDNKIPVGSSFNVILANINLNTILAQLPGMKQHIAKNGVVLLSGLLTGDEDAVLAMAKQQKLQLITRLEKEGWICLVLINS